MKIKAVNDKIVVKELKRQQTKGGILIPETSKSAEPQAYGKVLSIGEDVGSSIVVDNIVMFHPGAGMAVILDNTVCRVLMYKEIYCVLDEEVPDLAPLVIGNKDRVAIAT